MFTNTRLRLTLALLLSSSLWSLSAMRVLAAPGDLDWTFGTGGVAEFSLTGNYEFFCVAQQSDGKLLVAGRKDLSPNPSRLVLRRHNADGSLDTSFGVGGEAIAEFTLPPFFRRVYGVPRALLVQADGKIVVVGYMQVDSPENTLIPGAAAWRFTSTGLLDTTFSNDGERLFLGTNVTQSSAYDVKLTSGKLLVLYQETKVVSTSFPTTHTYSRLVRLNSDGSTDTTFGFLGSVQLNYSFTAYVLAVNQHTGVIYAGGDYVNNQFVGGRVYRYTSGGALDPSYGFGGNAIPPSCNDGTYTYDNYPRSLALQADDKLVAGGIYATVGSEYQIIIHPTLSRLSSGGAADTSFGNNGSVCLPCSGGNCPNWQGGMSWNENVRAKLQADSKIVALAGDSFYPFLQRRNSNGTEDTLFMPAFSSQGKTLDLLIQPGSGKIVVLASTTSGYRLIRSLP
jgi:uncharacterized delta-60 repeat protein